MKTCPNCGIEHESGYSECPLCHNRFEEDRGGKPERKSTYPGLEKPLTRKESVNLFWELSGILHFSSLLMIFFIDLILNKQPGWSWYAISGLTASFIYITLLVFTARLPFIFLSGILVNTCALLFTIDMLNGTLTWFVVPALPLVVFLVLFIALIILFSRLTLHKGLNIIAAVSMGIAAYVIVIDLCISWIKHRTVTPTWSIVVASAILPFAVFLLYFHYRLKRGTSLRKFFHL